MAVLLFKKLKRILLDGPCVALELWLQSREGHFHFAGIKETFLGSCRIKQETYFYTFLLLNGKAVCDMPYQTAFLQ